MNDDQMNEISCNVTLESVDKRSREIKVEENLKLRPVVFDFKSPHLFLGQLLQHYKVTGKFSIRQRLKQTQGCSPALISQIMSGKRRLTRDQLPMIGKVFNLSQFETDYIDQSLQIILLEKWQPHQGHQPILNKQFINRLELGGTIPGGVYPIDRQKGFKPALEKRNPKNHILSSWTNLYVKDLVNLKGFSLKTSTLCQMLFGLISPRMIERSVSFLLREGFWRQDLEKGIVAEDPAIVSTNEIPNGKIKNFHKKAIKLALRGIDNFPMQLRKSSTILVSVDQDKLTELRKMIDEFQGQLLRFIEENPEGSDHLVQITLHLTPIGGSYVHPEDHH